MADSFFATRVANIQPDGNVFHFVFKHRRGRNVSELFVTMTRGEAWKMQQDLWQAIVRELEEQGRTSDKVIQLHPNIQNRAK